MIYDKWVLNFIKNYNKDIKLEILIAEISHSLQFNDTPTFELIKSGEVDCVAAAAITASILGSFFLDYRFEVVCLPRLPWVDGVNDSKHCAVVQFLGDDPILIIDPTPINGYGYGKISKKLKISEWQKIRNGWKLKKQPKISKCKFWEDHLYPEFLLITPKDVQKIFEINNARYFIKNNNVINIKCDSPKNSPGWIKEYWRTRAELDVLNKNIEEAIKCYKRALKASLYNPYLLEEVILFCQKNKVDDCFDINLLKKIKKLATENLIKSHEEAIRAWNSKKIKCLHDKKWENYIYYLGNIFWRKQSITLLKNNKLDLIPILKIGDVSLKIFKLSPAWFKNNQAGVLISKSAINNKDILFQTEFNIDDNSKNFCDKFLKVKIKNGYISIVNKNFIYKRSAVYDKLLAHQQFLGLTKRELIIL